MTQEEKQKFESGYNEGMMYAIQLMASESLRIVGAYSSLLRSDKVFLSARIKMTAKHILQRKGIVPSDHEVFIGKAEPVDLDFNMTI